MNKPIIIITLLLTAIITFNVSANSKSVDTANLDIAGVKLGMTEKQAFQSIEKKLKLKNKLSRRSGTDRISIKYNQDTIIIIFTATTIDPKNLAEVVSGVYYKTPYSVGNNALMKKNAAKKYNAQLSYCSDEPCIDYVWCKVTKTGCSQNHPTLRYYGNELSLVSMRYMIALNKLRNKEVTGQSAF